MSEISDKMLQAIKASDLSYSELAKLTGISKSALQRYATGETEKIPIDRVEAIAYALGVSAQYILGWESPPTQLYADKNGNYNLPLTKTEQGLISDFRSLSTQGQDYILQTMDMVKDKYKQVTSNKKVG